MSENRQFVENPLLVTDLFPKGVFYFGESVSKGDSSSQNVENEVDSQQSVESVVNLAVEEKEVEPQADSVKLLQENDIENEGMVTLTVINLFFDDCDAHWDGNTQESYNKLMSAVRVNQEAVIPEDIESIHVSTESEYQPGLLNDRRSPVIFVWSDRNIANTPELFKVKVTERGVMLRFPSFCTMCGDVNQKKMVWQTMKTILKF